MCAVCVTLLLFYFHGTHRRADVLTQLESIFSVKIFIEIKSPYGPTIGRPNIAFMCDTTNNTHDYCESKMCTDMKMTLIQRLKFTYFDIVFG